MDVIEKVERFYRKSKLEKFSIGKTHLGKDIYCFKVTKTQSPKLIIQYSIHAREYITSLLALKQIKNFVKKGKRGQVYFLPLVNPDGVGICLREKPLYKANANGVDLNVNFDAGWGKGEKNIFVKGDENFVGEYPFSEKESRALRDFTLRIRPNATVSYHSKGEEIYYQFHQDEKNEKRDLMLAEKIAKATGYKIKSTPNSYGGYKDWCIKTLKIPSFTIEVGSDEYSHPLREKCLRKIYRKNKRVIEVLTENL